MVQFVCKSVTLPARVVLAVSDSFIPGLIAACSIAVACAVLSVFVVSRRWAFIGEGIAHSGFGGAGTVWLLALAFPDVFEQPWAPYLGVVAFCVGTALLIGYVARGQGVNADAAIGIFMVASLAWGFLAQYVYVARTGKQPVGWDQFLFGEMGRVSGQFALVALASSAATVGVVALLGKEIVFYCFDPAMAEASGVRAGLIHYLLMLLLALTIVIGVRIAGSVLVTALLVLPGATALLVSQRLRTTMTAAIVLGLVGAVIGLLIGARWHFLPAGPSIVLTLFLLFVGTYVVTRVRRRGAAPIGG